MLIPPHSATAFAASDFSRLLSSLYPTDHPTRLELPSLNRTAATAGYPLHTKLPHSHSATFPGPSLQRTGPEALDPSPSDQQEYQRLEPRNYWLNRRIPLRILPDITCAATSLLKTRARRARAPASDKIPLVPHPCCLVCLCRLNIRNAVHSTHIYIYISTFIRLETMRD